MSLLSLQRDIRAWLVHEDQAAAGRMGAAAMPGLGIYQNNYRAQLVACLESSFPQMRAWIGDEAFLRAAALHVDRVPPSSWTLDAYSRDFPATLALLYRDDPEIGEIARIELALEEAFVTCDWPALAVDQLRDVAWDRAILRISPAIEFVDLATNAFAIWSALIGGELPPQADRLEDAGTALIWRQGHRARIRLIDTFECQALLKVRVGTSFGDLCEGAAELFGRTEGAACAGTWLGRWIGDGLIVGIDHRQDPH